MRFVLRFFALALLSLFGGATASAHAADPSYRLSTKGWIGDYRQTELSDVTAAYGEPESATPADEGYGCTLHWPAIGLTVETATFGTDDSDPCTDGIFVGAGLTGPNWFTNSGLRVGVSASTAKAKARRKCRSGECWNPLTRRSTRNGYVLSDHPNECAGARTPTLVALTSKGKVSGFAMNWLGCE